MLLVTSCLLLFILYKQLYLCIMSVALPCLVLSCLSSLLTFTSKPANNNIGRNQGTSRERGWSIWKDIRSSSRLSSTTCKLALHRWMLFSVKHNKTPTSGSKELNKLNTVSPRSPLRWPTSLSPPSASFCPPRLAGAIPSSDLWVLLTLNGSIVFQQPSHRSMRWIWTPPSPTLQSRWLWDHDETTALGRKHEWQGSPHKGISGSGPACP